MNGSKVHFVSSCLLVSGTNKISSTFHSIPSHQTLHKTSLSYHINLHLHAYIHTYIHTHLFWIQTQEMKGAACTKKFPIRHIRQRQCHLKTKLLQKLPMGKMKSLCLVIEKRASSLPWWMGQYLSMWWRKNNDETMTNDEWIQCSAGGSFRMMWCSRFQQLSTPLVRLCWHNGRVRASMKNYCPTSQYLSPFIGPIIFDWTRKGGLRPDRVIWLAENEKRGFSKPMRNIEWFDWPKKKGYNPMGNMEWLWLAEKKRL